MVVGGTSGIGFEAAKAVLERGGSQLLRHGAVTAITADISEPDGVTQVLKAIRTEHRDIDLLVNAAGVFFPKSFLEHTEADYERYMAVNKAILFISQAVASNLVEQSREGAIVNIGSMWAQQAIAATPSSAYSMAKAGLHSLTQHLAMELASKGIRVNAVSPAVVDPNLRGLHCERSGA